MVMWVATAAVKRCDDALSLAVRDWHRPIARQPPAYGIEQGSVLRDWGSSGGDYVSSPRAKRALMQLQEPHIRTPQQVRPPGKTTSTRSLLVRARSV